MLGFPTWNALLAVKIFFGFWPQKRRQTDRDILFLNNIYFATYVRTQIASNSDSIFL
jgi:hypothetical protein